LKFYFFKAKSGLLKKIFALLSVMAVVIGTGFVCRSVTLNSLQLKSKGNITLVSIMPEDNEKDPAILNAVKNESTGFMNKNNDYLGYEMPVDYIMQKMIANNTTRIPVGFIDIDTKTGEIMNVMEVDTKTVRSDVPTPAI
jgi:hypothetical protein